MQYYVNCSAAPNGDGSQARPFRHIQQAALLALPGDEVLVAPGIYRSLAKSCSWVSIFSWEMISRIMA